MRKKIKIGLISIFSSLTGLYIFLLITDFFAIRRIKANWLDLGTVEVFRSIFDIMAPFLSFIIFMLFFLFFYEYYKTAVLEDDLVNRFSLATFIMFLTFPVIVLIYRLIYSLDMMVIDNIISFGGLGIGLVIFYIYFITRKPKWKEPE